MKYIFTIALLVLINTSCRNTSNIENENNAETNGADSKTINKVVSQSEFKSLLKNSEAQLIDVRTAEEHSEGSIPNSVNIDFYAEDFKTQLAKLDKNKPVLVYCRSGNRSGQTSQILNEMGFKEVYDLEGGFSAWEE